MFFFNELVIFIMGLPLLEYIAANLRWMIKLQFPRNITYMCGRFTQSYTWRELVELYRLTQPAVNLRPRYNIAPTTAIDVVTLVDAGPELVPMRWGLIPGWWKKTGKEVPSTFNARAETVAEKPMFRSAFKRTRCIVPASGYYEWRAVEGGKQPYFISAADGAVLSLAGLAYGMSGETGKPASRF